MSRRHDARFADEWRLGRCRGSCCSLRRAAGLFPTGRRSTSGPASLISTRCPTAPRERGLAIGNEYRAGGMLASRAADGLSMVRDIHAGWRSRRLPRHQPGVSRSRLPFMRPIALESALQLRAGGPLDPDQLLLRPRPERGEVAGFRSERDVDARRPDLDLFPI